MDCADTFINLVNSMENKKDCVLYYLQHAPDRAFVREKLMHVSEDTQVPPDWVSEWK